MGKKRIFLMYLFLLTVGIGMAFADVTPTRTDARFTEAAQIATKSKPTEAQLMAIGTEKMSAGAAAEKTSLQEKAMAFAAKKAAAKRVTTASLAGSRTSISHRSTGALYTVDATVTAVGDDSVSISGFTLSTYTVKAKIDAATGAVTIPSQKVATMEGYGDLYVCKVNTITNTYSPTDAITGTAVGGDIHINDAFGFFITEGAKKGATLNIGVITYADIATKNATFTNNAITYSGSTFTTTGRTVTASTDWAYVYQLTDDQMRVSNIPGKSENYDMLVQLNGDGTITIDPQTAYKTTLYTFCYYKLTETISGTTVKIQSSILSPLDASFDASTKTMKLGKWMTGYTSATGSGSVLDMSESSTMTTTADIVFPTTPAFSFEGEGTEASPYLIKTADDLYALSRLYKDAKYTSAEITADGDTYRKTYAGKYFKLANDIEFSSFKKAMKPIGDLGYHFAGTFDGAGYTISNFSITDYAYDGLGLFGCVDSAGVVKNIKFATPYLTSLGYSIGTVAGKSYGLVEGCEVTGGKIYASAGLNAGGVVGYNFGTIKNCKFIGSGYITSLGYMGGIAGRSYGPISGCSAAANMAMTLKTTFTGGIVGYGGGYYSGKKVSADITDCDFTGRITATPIQCGIGGIAGMTSTISVERCYATSHLFAANSSDVYVGGLMGAVWETNISDCYAAGYVSGSSTNYVGGLIGHATVSSTANSSTIKNSISSAQIITQNTGKLYGITGDAAEKSLAIENCYYDKQIALVDSATFARTTAQLTTGEALAGFDASVWKFEKGLYPRLQTKASEPSALLAATPLTMNSDDNVNQIKNNFVCPTANGITWKGVVDGKYSETGGYAYTLSGDTAVLNYKQRTDTIYAFKDEMSKFYIVNIAPMTLNGEGTEASPWEIATKEDLFMLSTLTNEASLEFEGCYFKMVNDIDCGGDTLVTFCRDDQARKEFKGSFDGNGHTIDNVAIVTTDYYGEGNTSGKPAGEINPKGNVFNYGGLFACIGAEGVVKNLTIGKNCVYDLFSYGGAIAGKSSGLIENCRNFAPVTVYFAQAGGIVGILAKGGTVRGCYNAGHIRVDYYNAGGIVGSSTSATIENCTNSGTVEATYFNSYRTEGSQYNAGGIVGAVTSSTIKNVLNTGDVTSYKSIGGIAGSATGTASAACTISGAVNYGFVYTLNDAGSMGAIIGANTLAKAEKSYYNKTWQKVGPANNGTLVGATGLTSSALATDTVALDKAVWTLTNGEYPVLTSAKDETKTKLDSKAVINFADGNSLSFITKSATLVNTTDLTWTLKEGKAFSVSGSSLNVTASAGAATDTLTVAGFGETRTLPIATLTVTGFEGEGTEASPFLIRTADDMLALSSFIETNGFDFEGFYFKVLNDLDFSGKTYVPVAYGANMFRGTFDGANHTLKNINYAAADATDKTFTIRGLFGVVGINGVVKNIILDNTNSFSAYQYCGAIAGVLYGTIENCSSAATVTSTGAGFAGGMAAYAYPYTKLIKCSNSGAITAATNYAGGIIGAANTGYEVEIDSCENTGDITAKTSYAGGIAGAGSAHIKYAVNKGAVKASTADAAGIIGNVFSPSSVRNSHNEGTIAANQYTAGIVAVAAAHTNDALLVIDSCYNTGEIQPAVTSAGKTSAYAGGIAGYLKEGFTISNCYNTADIKASLAKSGYIGGIAGYGTSKATAKSRVENCYNTGNISPDRYAGGIVGSLAGNDNTTITNCYNTGNITTSNTSSSYAGGIVGYGTYIMTYCYNTGDITGVSSYVGGVSGYYNSYPYTFDNNFNVGTVKATSSKALYVGGVMGMGRPYMTNCANYGEVTGYNYVGGVLGRPAAVASEVYHFYLLNCYNAAKVTATASGASAGNIMSENTSAKYKTLQNCYFDSTVSPASSYDETLSTEGVTALTHAQIIAQDMGDAFTNGTAIYPQLKYFEQNAAHSFGVATILLAEGDSESSVTKAFKVGTPYGAVWTSSSNLVVNGNDVSLNNSEKEEDATLTLTVGNLTRTYKLHIVNDPTGISHATSAGSEAIAVKYYTVNGTELDAITGASGVVIEKTTHADGTVTTRKFVPRR